MQEYSIINPEIFDTIIAALTLLLSLYIFKREPIVSICIPRHSDLISPLFYMIQPYLYGEIPEDVRKSIKDLIDKNVKYVEAPLMDLIERCQAYPCPENMNKLSEYIDREYDLSCYRVGLKCRSVNYRIKKHQIPSIKWMIIHLMPTILLWVIVFLGCLLGMLYFVGLIIKRGMENVENISPYHLMFIGIALLAGVKYVLVKKV